MCKHSFADFTGPKHTFARHMTSLDFRQQTVEELVSAGGNLDDIFASVSGLVGGYPML